MQRFPRNPRRGSHAGEAARKQLRARLLDEGCNLHPVLARITFYERFERRLASDLPADIRLVKAAWSSR